MSIAASLPPGPPPGRVRPARVAETARFALDGELDLASEADFARLERAVDASPGQALDVDISRVTFVDAAALGAFVLARVTATERGGTLLLTGARAPVRRVFRLAQLEGLLEERAED